MELDSPGNRTVSALVILIHEVDDLGSECRCRGDWLGYIGGGKSRGVASCREYRESLSGWDRAFSVVKRDEGQDLTTRFDQ